jgi:hypothetical protein
VAQGRCARSGSPSSQWLQCESGVGGDVVDARARRVTPGDLVTQLVEIVVKDAQAGVQGMHAAPERSRTSCATPSEVRGILAATCFSAKKRLKSLRWPTHRSTRPPRAPDEYNAQHGCRQAEQVVHGWEIMRPATATSAPVQYPTFTMLPRVLLRVSSRSSVPAVRSFDGTRGTHQPFAGL